MIYFETSDIYLAISFAFAFGLLFGGIYGSLCTVNFGLISVFRAFSFFYCRVDFRSIFQRKRYEYTGESKVVTEIFDFFFFLTVGMLYISLVYIALDGVFRLYMLIFAVLGFYISRKTLGALFEKIIKLIVYFVSVVWSALLFVLFFPARIIIHKIFIPFAVWEHFKLLSWRSKRLSNRKIQRNELFFLKA